MTDPRILAWHTAQALRAWTDYARTKGADVPPELDQAAVWLRTWAMEGQAGSAVAVLAEWVDSRGMEPLLLDLEDTAGALSVSLSTVKRLVRDGTLPAVKAGSRTLVRREDLVAYTQQLEPLPGAAAPGTAPETGRESGPPVSGAPTPEVTRG